MTQPLYKKVEFQIYDKIARGEYPLGSKIPTEHELAEELKVPVGRTTSDGVFTLNATRCLGACGLAPVMMINDDVYGRLTDDQVPGILAKYKAS